MAYIVTGSMVRSNSGSISRNPIDAVIFSLGAGTTSGLPSVGLRAAGAWVYLITGIQATLSIALTGLLGFVIGHRIRR